MIARIRRGLISLAFVQWVSAAPTVQHSDLPLVESLPATCNLDFNQIQHDLCTLVHSISEIVDEATLAPPIYVVDVGGAECTMGTCIYRDNEEAPAVAARLQTSSNTIIIRYNPQPPTSSGFHFPGSQLSVNVRGTVINLLEMRTDELDSVGVNDGCAHRLAWQLLDTCGVESLKIAVSDELLQEGEMLVKDKVKSKVVSKNSKLFKSGDKTKQKDYNINKDASRANEDDGGSPDNTDPTDEELEQDERELIPPTDRNPWSLITIVFMTISMLIVAARQFYVRWGRPVRSYRKPLRFHVGEATLLRWASEDMIFDNEELPDTIANGNEEMPLNPSPTKGFVIQYGSSA